MKLREFKSCTREYCRGIFFKMFHLIIAEQTEK